MLYHNMPATISFSNIQEHLFQLSAEELNMLSSLETPAFEIYQEHIKALLETLAPFQTYTTILLVANGGSLWSSIAYNTALGKNNGKRLIVINDMDPDRILRMRQECSHETSLVVVISKSGSAIGIFETLFALWDYPKLFVTIPETPLAQVGEREHIVTILHPEVSGRYSSFTSSAYVPSILLGLPVEEIENGGREGYAMYNTVNEEHSALRLATALFRLEEKGYAEVFLPIYSHFLRGFSMIVTQLFHESFGKDGKGLTVLAAEAPESQHHTNQRFFGGRKNMIGCFLHTHNVSHDINLNVPKSLQNISLHNGSLGDLHKQSLTRSFQSEYEGTVAHAKESGIPTIEISVSHISGYEIGNLMAFWHYVSVFSSLLRGVNPYNQPEVERSKEIALRQRNTIR